MRRGRLAASATRLTFKPPLKKKNGVRSEKATTRKRRCSSGCSLKMRATARPSRNAGSTAWLFARSAVHMSRKLHRERSLDLRFDDPAAVARKEPGLQEDHARDRDGR